MMLTSDSASLNTDDGASGHLLTTDGGASGPIFAQELKLAGVSTRRISTSRLHWLECLLALAIDHFGFFRFRRIKVLSLPFGTRVTTGGHDQVLDLFGNVFVFKQKGARLFFALSQVGLIVLEPSTAAVDNL